MGYYDIMAMIERINKDEDKKCKKVSIVAHSLGTVNTISALSLATRA